jgi:phage protein D/phage baseplate assembly protein gpV
MPESSDLASQITIKLDGTQVQPEVMANILSVVVDQHVSLPDMFTIRLQDPEFELIDNGPFDLTKEIEIAAETQEGQSFDLIKGEITAIEPAFQEGMLARLIVRGYDKSHRLYRETKSKAHLNKKDSDLAEEIARGVGLQTEIETTSIVYDHIYQDNQTDLTFLRHRAWRIGYECFVSDGKLYFRKPTTERANLTLIWGKDLLSFHPRMTLAEQVDEVVVKGWDVDKQTPIVGRASRGNLYPAIGESKDGASWSSEFGTGKLIIVNHPVTNQSEADALAAARLDEISGAFIQAEGVALRHPDIKAGCKITLEALGDRFSGTYLVTNANHVYSAEGFKTTFAVKGARKGSITEQMGQLQPDNRWIGVVTAVVTNTDDPSDWGRVKVKYPWITEDAESQWARVVGSGAGPDAGLFIMPDVGDEVLVAFEHGDFSRPCVIGGLWNGQSTPPPEAQNAGSGEKPLVRTWHSRTGHWIAMYDNADNKIEIITQGGNQIVLDDANQQIIIKSNGGLSLTMDDGGSKITVESGNEIELISSGNMTLQSNGNMDIQASGMVNIKGSMINLN